MRRLRLIYLVAALLIVAGCKNSPPDTVRVSGMNVNGYVFDYDLDLKSPSSIKADAQDVHINTGTARIEIVAGTLRVNGHSFGPVGPKDRISLEHDTVRVNGTERKKVD